MEIKKKIIDTILKIFMSFIVFLSKFKFKSLFIITSKFIINIILSSFCILIKGKYRNKSQKKG